MNFHFIFILILFSFSYCDEKFISLKLEIYRDIYFKFPIKINGKKLDGTFYALESNSDVNLIVGKSIYCDNEMTKENCYTPDSNKYQNKKEKFSLYRFNYTERLYKDKITINNTLIGEWDFIFLDKKVTEDYDAIFNFNSKTLKKLKKNKNISKQVITYEKPYNNSINVYIGKDYSKSKFKYYSKCSMEKGIYGCKMNTISIANTKDDFLNKKNIKSKSFNNIDIKAEFYLLEGQDDVIYGPEKLINEIYKFLNESEFKCNQNPFSIQSVNCFSENKKGFLNFGDSIIIINNITFIMNNNLNHLYFTLNAIKDLNAIIDVEDNNIIFYSEKENVILSTPGKAGKYALYIFIIILILALIGIVIYFFVYYPKKYPTGSVIQIDKKYNLI